MRERAILERLRKGDRRFNVAAIYRDTDPRLHGRRRRCWPISRIWWRGAARRRRARRWTANTSSGRPETFVGFGSNRNTRLGTGSPSTGSVRRVGDNRRRALQARHLGIEGGCRAAILAIVAESCGPKRRRAHVDIGRRFFIRQPDRDVDGQVEDQRVRPPMVDSPCSSVPVPVTTVTRSRSTLSTAPEIRPKTYGGR